MIRRRRGFTLIELLVVIAIIENANSRDIIRCDIFNPGHLPASDSTDVTNGRRIARDRHREGCNALFVDWHSEYVRAEKMTVDMWRDR